LNSESDAEVGDWEGRLAATRKKAAMAGRRGFIGWRFFRVLPDMLS
jgi:hypothetical protein